MSVSETCGHFMPSDDLLTCSRCGADSAGIIRARIVSQEADMPAMGRGAPGERAGRSIALKQSREALAIVEAAQARAQRGLL
jgi:hypothetical protein